MFMFNHPWEHVEECRRLNKIISNNMLLNKIISNNMLLNKILSNNVLLHVFLVLTVFHKSCFGYNNNKNNNNASHLYCAQKCKTNS